MNRLLLCALLAACGGGGSSDDGGAVDGNSIDAGPADAGTLVTENCPTSYGPSEIAATFEVADMGVGFDLDDDAAIDNIVASDDALRIIVNNSLQDSMDSGSLRLLSEERDFSGVGGDDSSVTVAAYGGIDSDDPASTADDFAGDEDYHYSHDSVYLDTCVPKALLTGSFTGGILDVSAESIGFFIDSLGGFLTFMRARYRGELEADTEGLRTPAGTPGLLGGVITQCSLNRAPGSISAFSLQYEITQIFDVQPDIDLDGDGLETVQTANGEGVISCTDGDGTTVVMGMDCGCDPRMGDGYSIAFTIDFRGATVLGPDPTP